MKNLLFIFTFFFFFFYSCANESNQKKTGKSRIKDKTVENGNSLFWKIEGKELQQPSYLFGTMHLIKKEYFILGDSLLKRLEQADALMMEIGDINPFAAISHMQLGEGEHISDFFSDEEYLEILDYVEREAGMDKQMFEAIYGNMKPFAILQVVASGKMGDSPESYELTFQAKAKKLKKEIIGLEDVEEQIGFFDQIPREKMSEMILSGIRDTIEEKEMEEMMQIYHQQKIDELLPYMMRTSPEIMEFEELLLTGRNKRWIPIIEKEIQDKMVFIAVGAAHLLGEKGVIQLLKNAGYTLTPIAVE